MSQTEDILRDLLLGYKLTALDTIRRHSCFRAAARIREIRKLGYDVKTEMLHLESGKRIARYFIEKKVDTEK